MSRKIPSSSLCMNWRLNSASIQTHWPPALACQPCPCGRGPTLPLLGSCASPGLVHKKKMAGLNTTQPRHNGIKSMGCLASPANAYILNSTSSHYRPHSAGRHHLNQIISCHSQSKVVSLVRHRSLESTIEFESCKVLTWVGPGKSKLGGWEFESTNILPAPLSPTNPRNPLQIHPHPKPLHPSILFSSHRYRARLSPPTRNSNGRSSKLPPRYKPSLFRISSLESAVHPGQILLFQQ